MPLSLKDFTEVLRRLPANATPEQIDAAAKHAEQGTPLEQLWATVNRPLAGSEDALIPQLRHKHSDDEGVVRRTAEDFGASLTSPVSIGTMALGGGAELAGAKGMLGISRAARVGEAALQAPFAAEGVKNVVEGDTPGQKLAGAAQAALAGHGMRSAMTHAFEPEAVVSRYVKERKVPATAPEPFNVDNAKRTADAYQEMVHNPGDPEVARSYDALKKEIKDQFIYLRDRAGVKMEPSNDNYANSAAMVADVRKNNHLNYFPTESAYGQGEGNNNHPLLQVDPDTKLSYNDMFRAVHDYFGHAAEGNQFGPKGEQAAYNAHRNTLTEPTHGALASETKGQNSWVNFGQHLRDAEGNVPGKGQPGYVAPAARPFAEQKAGLLPEYQGKGPLPSAAELADSRYTDVASGRKPATAASQSPQSSVAPQVALSPELLADVNQRHAMNGGSTTDLNAGRGLTAQDARFVVSPYEDRQLILNHPPTEQDLRNYIAKNEDLLTKPGHNLGTWNNNGQHNLDVSIGENDLQKALDLGAQHKQLAIYDMVDGKDIPVPTQEHVAANAENIQRNAPYGEGSIIPSAMRPSELSPTALAVAAPAASSQIDDSDPNDPHQQLKHYAKLGLDLAGLAGGAAAFGMAGIRKTAMAPQKAAAAKGAAYMLLGGSKVDWMKRMLAEGTPKEELDRIRAGSEKILKSQLARAETQMPNAKKLLAHFDSGKADMGWYDKTHEEVSKLFGKDTDLMLKLLAATSTNSTVKSNTTLALKAYYKIKAGEPINDGFLPVVVKQINRVINGEPLEGRKIDNFAKALTGDENAVVVDRWMMRAFGFPENKLAASPHEYDVIEHAVKEMAQRAGVTPRQMQASIWFAVKNAAEKGTGRPASPPYEQLLREKLEQRTPQLPF